MQVGDRHSPDATESKHNLRESTNDKIHAGLYSLFVGHVISICAASERRGSNGFCKVAGVSVSDPEDSWHRMNFGTLQTLDSPAK